MERDKVASLVKELVVRILPSRGDLQESGREDDGKTLDAAAQRAYQYAMRIIGSRISPSLTSDEAAMAESIKRQLVLEGRSSDALTFADLYRRFSAQTGPGSIESKWSFLYLLRVLSEDQRRLKSETKGAAVPLISTISGAAAQGALPALPDHSLPKTTPNHSPLIESLPPGGILTLCKDPENTKLAAIKDYTQHCQDESQVSEMALVRDVIYACQGIDGRYVKYDQEADGYVVQQSVRVPKAWKTLVCRLCEVGWLYRRVHNYITESLVDGPMEAIGTVGQAFCSALQEELSEYYRLMAVLESQTHIPIPFISDVKVTGNYLSLRRLVVWLAEPLVRMRLMAVLVDDCRGSKGGAMAGSIHMHAQHGDPLVRDFMRRLLCRVCSPLFEMVRRWVLEGELVDIYEEFFVVAEPVKAEALWQEGYRLQSRMLPSFIPEPLAQRILRTGKSINFLRVCCEDQGWASAASEAVDAAGTSGGRGALGYGETEVLEALVIEAAKRIDKHLIKIIFERYKFREHCLAIKRYLLLGQGDFIQYLMDIIGPDLNQPANTLSAFKLSGLLESAIRASNAQYDDGDALDRLRVKMMQYNDGDRGWDVFSLEYYVQTPLNTIFTESVMAGYLRIFNFLWRLKRVEHALSATWQTMKPNCSIGRIYAVSGGGEKPQLLSILRRYQCLRNDMNHFVRNLQYYIMFEVLEYSWAKFLEEMDEARDLDELIAAHEKYLNSIVEKALLGERSELLRKTLFTLFDLMLGFHGLAERLYENVQGMQARNGGPRQKQRKDFQQSHLVLGKKVTNFQTSPGDFWKRMGDEMDRIALDYSSLLEGFIAQLPVQEHVDLKFLSFRLDFSEFYARQHMSMSTIPLKLKRTPIRGTKSLS